MEDGSYQLEPSVGVTSVTFTGIGITNGYDPNSGDLPVGGVIVSVGSSSGFGYQPRRTKSSIHWNSVISGGHIEEQYQSRNWIYIN